MHKTGWSYFSQKGSVYFWLIVLASLRPARKTIEPRHDKTNKVSLRPAKTQISLGIRPVWLESSLSARGSIGSLTTHWADSEDSDQTGRMPRLIWVFAGRTVILLVLSWGGSIIVIMVMEVRRRLSRQTCKQWYLFFFFFICQRKQLILL